MANRFARILQNGLDVLMDLGPVFQSPHLAVKARKYSIYYVCSSKKDIQGDQGPASQPLAIQLVWPLSERGKGMAESFLMVLDLMGENCWQWMELGESWRKWIKVSKIGWKWIELDENE